jgi:hypothetical protein
MKESIKLAVPLVAVFAGVFLLTVLKVRRIRSFSRGERILYLLIAAFIALTVFLRAQFHFFGT